MNPYMQVPYKTRGKFRIGDHVRILHGRPGMIGEVVEDHGNLGVGGMRLYSVKLRLDEWNEVTSPYPEDSLEPADAVASRGA